MRELVCEILPHKVPAVTMTGPSTMEPLGRPIEDIEAEHGPIYAAWEAFGRWLDAWRDEHPEDGRDDLELIDVYAAQAGADQ